LIGFIVEGRSDEKVVEEISKKLRVFPKIKKMGKTISPRKAKAFAEFLLDLDCEKVIILKDSHCSNPTKIEENLRNRLEEENLRDKMFKKNGMEYLKGGEDPKEIAKRLKLEKVITKCPSFIKFKQIIE
jgi:5S rRNA maturation endonuclease (ribonuclease M5)